MSQAPIMPFYTDAYLADTMTLSTEAHGAYLLLLLYTWRSNGEPPADDDVLLCKITRLSLRKWKSVRSQLEGFFDLSDGVWRQKKLDKTWKEVMQKLEHFQLRSEKAHSAKKSTKTKDAVCLLHATSMQQARLSINHEPVSINQEEKVGRNAAKQSSPPAPMEKTPSREMKKDMKKESYTPPPTPALDALKPMLSDTRYTLKFGEGYVSASLLPQITQAQAELAMLLAPVEELALQSMLQGLFAHFGNADERRRAAVITQDYHEALAPFPEDLLRAAYRKLLQTHRYHTLPKIADFMPHLEPDLARRQSLAIRLERVREKAGKGL